MKLRKTLSAAGLAGILLSGCGGDRPPPMGPREVPEEPEVENTSPVINSNPPRQINEGSFYEYRVRATDAEGDVLNYSLTEGPDWLSVSHNIVFGRAPEVLRDSTFPVTLRVSDNKDPSEQSYDLIVRNLSNTYVLTGDTLSRMRVERDRLVFSQPMNFSVGDVVAADIGVKTPSGFLRRVTSVSSDSILFNTTQATIEEAVKEGSFSFQGRISPSNIQHSNSLRGISSSQNDIDFIMGLNEVILYDGDGNHETTHDQLAANGNVSFGIGYELDLDIKRASLEEMVFKLNVFASYDLSLRSSLDRGIFHKEINLAEISFKPFIIGYLPTLIPIPLIVKPELDIDLNFLGSIKNLEARVRQEVDLSAGISYRNGRWSPIREFSNTFNFDFQGVDETEFNLELSSGPKLSFPLYGVAGPQGAIHGFLGLNADSREWSLNGGLRALVGAEVEIFGREIIDHLENVIEYSEVLARGEIGREEPVGGEKILFVRRLDPNRNIDIYTMNSNGSQQRNLTNSSSLWDIHPSWSPDGTKIIYSSKVPFSGDDDNIYVMNSDGSMKTMLTNHSMDESNPVFSPDGARIAYGAGYAAGHSQVYIMNSDGSNPVRITNENDYYFWDLSWTPCQRIAFVSNRDDEKGEIYTMNPNGRDIRRLTNNSNFDRDPSWSPDCTKIIYSSNRTGTTDIYIMNSDGSNQRNISNTIGVSDGSPSWSPDGSKIVYNSGTGNSSEIWVMNSDGSNKTRITRNSLLDGSPVWFPRTQ